MTVVERIFVYDVTSGFVIVILVYFAAKNKRLWATLNRNLSSIIGSFLTKIRNFSLRSFDKKK